MEEKKEYLNEEKYQKTKNKIKILSIIILVVGLLIGMGLILFGVYKQSKVDEINKQREIEATKVYEEKLQERDKKIEEIQKEIDKLNDEYNTKKAQCDSISMSTGASWFSEKSKCQVEAMAIKTKVTTKEMEKFKEENTNINKNYEKATKEVYIPLYMIGGFIIATSIMFSLFAYMIAKRREITAFSLQQTMPVTQEAITKMAPTIGEASSTILDKSSESIGKVSKEVAKGIKDGLNNKE